MKGTQPASVRILFADSSGSHGVWSPVSFVNILEHPDINAECRYAEWPTFPQLWIKGELIGGCDIVLEMYQSGELKPMVEAASPEASA